MIESISHIPPLDCLAMFARSIHLDTTVVIVRHPMGWTIEDAGNRILSFGKWVDCKEMKRQGVEPAVEVFPRLEDAIRTAAQQYRSGP